MSGTVNDGGLFQQMRHAKVIYHMSDTEFMAALYTGDKASWSSGKGSAGLTVVKDLQAQKQVAAYTEPRFRPRRLLMNMPRPRSPPPMSVVAAVI